MIVPPTIWGRFFPQVAQNFQISAGAEWINRGDFEASRDFARERPPLGGNQGELLEWSVRIGDGSAHVPDQPALELLQVMNRLEQLHRKSFGVFIPARMRPKTLRKIEARRVKWSHWDFRNERFQFP
jgi:hypothetical protein